jgi:hypothetical protein
MTYNLILEKEELQTLWYEDGSYRYVTQDEVNKINEYDFRLLRGIHKTAISLILSTIMVSKIGSVNSALSLSMTPNAVHAQNYEPSTTQKVQEVQQVGEEKMVGHYVKDFRSQAQKMASKNKNESSLERMKDQIIKDQLKKEKMALKMEIEAKEKAEKQASIHSLRHLERKLERKFEQKVLQEKIIQNEIEGKYNQTQKDILQVKLPSVLQNSMLSTLSTTLLGSNLKKAPIKVINVIKNITPRIPIRTLNTISGEDSFKSVILMTAVLKVMKLIEKRKALFKNIGHIGNRILIRGGKTASKFKKFNKYKDIQNGIKTRYKNSLHHIRKMMQKNPPPKKKRPYLTNIAIFFISAVVAFIVLPDLPDPSLENNIPEQPENVILRAPVNTKRQWMHTIHKAIFRNYTETETDVLRRKYWKRIIKKFLLALIAVIILNAVFRGTLYMSANRVLIYNNARKAYENYQNYSICYELSDRHTYKGRAYCLYRIGKSIFFKNGITPDPTTIISQPYSQAFYDMCKTLGITAFIQYINLSITPD